MTSADDLADVAPALLYARAAGAAWTLHRASAGGLTLFGRADLDAGSSLLAAVHADDRARAREVVDAGLAAQGSFAVEYRLAGPSPRWVIDRGRRRGSHVIGVIVELDHDRAGDRARQTELEARLVEAQKLEAIGRLAGGVAHDFNNILTGILGHAARLHTLVPGEGGAHHAIATIEEAARRAAHLTQQLLGFARKGKVQDVVFDLSTAVDDALALFAIGLDPAVRLARPAPVAVAVRGDPSQIQQVVVNLAINAREALGERGGTIAVAVDRVDRGGSPLARLSVTDDGPGIPDAQRGLIFEPFFTTKPQGTGMGLPMAYGIAKNHGGFIEVDSPPGRGCTLAMYLPLVVAQRTSESTELLIVPPAERARVLFVDDEELVRYAARAQIEGLGHSVVLAKDGREALTLYQEGHFDVVVLDLTMPRMDGAACLRELRKIAPRAKVILSTGFGRDGVAQDVMDLGVSGVLEKPYRQHDLAAAIRAALHEA